MPGTPFRPTRCIAVDMFPHTDNLEAVMLFERGDEFLKQFEEREKRRCEIAKSKRIERYGSKPADALPSSEDAQ